MKRDIGSALLILLLLVLAEEACAQNEYYELDYQVQLVEIGASQSTLFSSIADYAIVSEDTLYILDSAERFVHVYRTNGDHLFSFGREGQGPGELIDPVAIDYCNGNIYIVDNALRRLNIYDSAGKYIRSVATGERPTDVYVNSKGIYVSVKSVTNILYCISHNRHIDPTIILSYDSISQLTSIPMLYRLGKPLLDGIGDTIIIAMPHTGNVITYNVATRQLYCSIPDVVYDEVNRIRSEWQSKDNVTLPIHITNVFHCMTIWDNTHILMSLSLDEGGPFVTRCVVLSMDGNKDSAYPELVSMISPYSDITRYRDKMIIYRPDKATIHVCQVFDDTIITP